MKRIGILLPLILCALLLSACAGNTSNAWRNGMDLSAVYSAEEVNDAMDAVEDHFRAEFPGCDLMNVRYDESAEVLGEQAGWADYYGAEDAIVLFSDFTTPRWVEDNSLQPNDCYINWKWVLTREEGGTWQLRLGERDEQYNP